MRRIISTSDSNGTSMGLNNRSKEARLLRELSFSLAVYGMVGWVYVAICGLVSPNTLHLPLTHLFPHLREDTSGVISFMVSFVGFVIYRVLRDSLRQSGAVLRGQAPRLIANKRAMPLPAAHRGSLSPYCGRPKIKMRKGP
jgi:hypothetical protein